MIREVVRRAMKLRKVTGKDLAGYVGIASSSVSQFLTGKMNLGQEKIELIFEHLGIELVLKENGQIDNGEK